MGSRAPSFASSFTPDPCAVRRSERRKVLKSQPPIMGWTRSGSLALLITRAMVISGDRTPQASGQTDRGLGSQQRSLVRRGQRSAMAVRRDDPSRLVGDSPSGAEASSGPPDTCRSTGCGVEKATEIPPIGTSGNCGRPHSYTRKLCSARAAALRALLARQNPQKSTPRSFGLGDSVGIACSRRFAPTARGTEVPRRSRNVLFRRVTRFSPLFEPRSRPSNSSILESCSIRIL